MLHYSGDTDGAVPTLGTQNWIATLGWKVTESWRAYELGGQVAGYLEGYEGDFTFATVHGAGHMAPQFKRPETYHLIFNWINQMLEPLNWIYEMLEPLNWIYKMLENLKWI